MMYLDESGKWERPTDIREAWRIERTCLIVGRKIIGKCLMGSTVNPMDKGGKQYKELWRDSDPEDRNANGRTKTGLYRLFVPAYEALEGFFDEYGNPIIEDPAKPVKTIEGDFVDIGAKTYLKNERDALKGDARELNEYVRQFPFTVDEAMRDSIEGSTFNIGKIYEQIEYNEELYPNPVVQGNFSWKNAVNDSEVVFSPNPQGRWFISWMPKPENRNKSVIKHGKKHPANDHIGVGGVDSYDLDSTTDNRGSKGACHMYNKFSMGAPANMFVAEYASRPPLARIFYEDILMAAVFFGYPLLIENNKYGIVRYFESRGYEEYVMKRPDHLKTPNAVSTKTRGIPSNSVDVIQSHAQAIEAYVEEHVGINSETGDMGKMYFQRTLEDWIGYKIDNRTKYDLTISSGLALLGAQKTKVKKKEAQFDDKQFFRRYTKEIRR